MSIFDQTNDQNDDKQDPLGSSNQDSFLARLVASKGEQWNNPEVIAKGTGSLSCCCSTNRCRTYRYPG